MTLLGKRGPLEKWEGGKYRRTKIMGQIKIRMSEKETTIYQNNNNPQNTLMQPVEDQVQRKSTQHSET